MINHITITNIMVNIIIRLELGCCLSQTLRNPEARFGDGPRVALDTSPCGKSLIQ